MTFEASQFKKISPRHPVRGPRYSRRLRDFSQTSQPRSLLHKNRLRAATGERASIIASQVQRAANRSAVVSLGFRRLSRLW